MTKDGVKKIMQVIVAAYPNFRPSQQDLEGMITVWDAMLSEYTDAQVANATRDWLKADKKGFAPSIGQIISMVHVDTKELTELEAWAMVSRALRNSSYNSESEYGKLPATVQAAVGCAEQLKQWACMDMGEVQSVAQSNFLRSYRAACGRAKLRETLHPEAGILVEERPALEEEPQEEREYVPMTERAKEMVERMRRVIA